MLLLGPATVAFGVPIYEQRALIRRHWPVLLIGMTAGTLASLATSWGLATLVGLDGTLRLSLLPRSISTPFAMEVAGDIGGVPDLTAVFVVVTGVAGAVIGDLILAQLPILSPLARGALFGLGAHGAGTARAHQIGETGRRRVGARHGAGRRSQRSRRAAGRPRAQVTRPSIADALSAAHHLPRRAMASSAARAILPAVRP